MRHCAGTYNMKTVHKRQIVRCDWLAVVNIMVAEWTDASCVDYTNYASS